jgi:hypothetical protein
MAKWKLKNCPRCGGDVYLDRDLNNWYEQCLQCSFRQELKKISQYKNLNRLPKPEILARRGEK